ARVVTHSFPCGLLHVIRESLLVPLDLVLALLPRLLALVQAARPVLDAPLLRRGFVPVHPDGGEVLVDRGAAGSDVVLLFREFGPLRLDARLSLLEVGRAGFELRSEGIDLFLTCVQ